MTLPRPPDPSLIAWLRRSSLLRQPLPLREGVTRWSQNPFALGYSFLATGTTPNPRRALAGADRNGRLIFAGEATEPDHAATAQGACLSGQTAACTILESTG
ncbi:FAD-dependent oxidoreductase [Tabrizicola sp.]|uniref:FAD-dependent oxidoreductase n=1 Tax=Tabrizicola sp. TaxID=2005166 RepID=UPI003F306A6E